MRVFSRHGFIEIVQSPGRPDQLLVRSQCEDDIKHLVGLFNKVASTRHEIIKDGDGFGIRLDRSVASVALGQLVMAITYERFVQSACDIHLGQNTQAVLTIQQNMLQIAAIPTTSHLSRCEKQTAMDKFINTYECPGCGETWEDSSPCRNNDRCPKCKAECEPVESRDIELPKTN